VTARVEICLVGGRKHTVDGMSLDELTRLVAGFTRRSGSGVTLRDATSGASWYYPWADVVSIQVTEADGG